MFRRIGMWLRGWRVGFPHFSAVGKVTVRSVNLFSLNEVDRFVHYGMGLSFNHLLSFMLPKRVCVLLTIRVGALYVYCQCFVNIWIQETFYDDNEFRCSWLSDRPQLLANNDHLQQLFLSEGADSVICVLTMILPAKLAVGPISLLFRRYRDSFPGPTGDLVDKIDKHC